MMTHTIQTFLEQVKEAGVTLGDSAPVDLVTAVQQQISPSQLRLLVVGTPGSGRFGLANVILGQPELLPVSPIPRLPLPVSIQYGETATAIGIAQDGINTPVPINSLRALLTNPDAHAAGYVHLKLHAHSDILRTSDLHIETIGAGRTTAAWKEVLAGADFVLLVLDAVALLSEQEKSFLRDVLQPYFGLERVAIIINKIDLVAGEERESLTELVRTFLGAFESQPLLLECSAAQASAGMTTGDMPADSGYDALMHLVRHDLLGRHRLLKVAAMQQAAELCLAELAAAAQRQQALLTTSEAELQELRDRLDPQSDWLRSRTERTQHRIEAFVSVLLKERCLRDIEAFSESLRQQLPDEVMRVEKVETIKRHLPGYIESLWQDFFTYQMPPLRNDLMDEMQQVSHLVMSDLHELLEHQPDVLHKTLQGFDPVPASMKTFLMPARGHHPAGTAATWMQVGGLAFLLPVFFLPQVSLLLIGVGQAVRMVYQRDIVAADKQAITASLLNATHELERQIKQQVDLHFASTTEELKQAVAEMYQQGIDQMRATIDDSIARYADVSARREQVDRLVQETIPELRQALDRLKGAEAA